jgi:YidC/Oxa1 family membrane protein insertase
MLPLAFQLVPQFMVDAGGAVLVFFHDNMGLTWGGAIIALTVATRAVLIPLTYKSLKGMRALQALQPQLKEIQARFRNDRQRMQQEMMRFYQENKVNPFASCIPLLAQAPIFLTLFYVLQKDLRLDICGQTATPCSELPAADWAVGLIPGSESFLFIPDLTAKATGAVLIILLVIYVVTQLFSGLVSTVTADKNQRMLILALPLIFVPIIINFPAGLILYWITTNIWTIGQQYTIQKLVPAPVALTPEEAKAAKPPPPPPRRKKKRR